MMNISEYFGNLVKNARDDEERDEIFELESVMYRVLEENELDFENWAHEEGIDLKATKKVCNGEELVLALWCWAMSEADE